MRRGESQALAGPPAALTLEDPAQRAPVTGAVRRVLCTQPGVLLSILEMASVHTATSVLESQSTIHTHPHPGDPKGTQASGK